jgi:hypothetical protein
LNPRRQPFQSVAILHVQQLAGCGRLRKSFQLRAGQTCCGSHCGSQPQFVLNPSAEAGQEAHVPLLKSSLFYGERTHSLRLFFAQNIFSVGRDVC